MSYIVQPCVSSGGGTPNPAAGPINSIQLSDGAGVLTYSAGFTYAGTTLTGSGANLLITTQAPSAGSDGGTLQLSAQSATGAGHSGGGITLACGAGTIGGVGGSLALVGGDSPGTGGDFGASGGQGTGGAGIGGSIFLTSGPGTAFGGSMYLTGGNGNVGGDLSLKCGSGVTDGFLMLGSSARDSTISITEDNSGNAKLGFFQTAPIVQPSTSIGSAAFSANAGTNINTASTFDGYTIPQIVLALRSFGLIA